MAVLTQTSTDQSDTQTERSLAPAERGAVAAEYAILLAGVAVAIATTVGLWGSALVAAIDQATSLISSLG